MKKNLLSQHMMEFLDSDRNDLQAVNISNINGVTYVSGATRSQLYAGEIIPVSNQMFQVVMKPKLIKMRGHWYSFKALVRKVDFERSRNE